MLRLEVAGKSFAGRTILQDVRLAVAAGEIVALTGPSGHGKSTLLRLAAGLDTDFAGTRTVASGARLAMVFQEPRLLPWRSVSDNLLLAGAQPSVAERLLADLDLSDAAQVMADRLSLGMARRVALARALAVSPDLLLLDEPFVSLDAASAARSRNLLLGVWSQHPCAVLLVTHDPAEAAALADRVVTLAGRPARVAREVSVPQEQRRGGAQAEFLDLTPRNP